MEWYRDSNVQYWINKNSLLKIKNDKLESLLDGVVEIIEIWRAESPAQIEWKRKWLEEVKELLRL